MESGRNTDTRVDQLSSLRTQISNLSNQRNKIMKELRHEATVDPSRTTFEGKTSKLEVCRSSHRVLNFKNLKEALYGELKGESDAKIDKFYQNLLNRLPRQDKIELK